MTENQHRPNIVPVAIGIALTCVLLFGLASLTKSRNNAQRTAAPQLTLVEPLAAASIDSPLVIRFKSAQPLELTETGWGYRNLHLHAWINDVQHMPAAAEIRAEDSTYVWTLPAIPRGHVALHLGWADQAHRPLRTGASDSAEVTVR